MAGKIQLSPAELLAQSAEMKALSAEYGELFSAVRSGLDSVNGSWSAVLARNFSGKITSAQEGFSKITAMLEAGSRAAEAGAKTFESVDSLLAKDSAVTEAGNAASAYGAVEAVTSGMGNVYSALTQAAAVSKGKTPPKKKSFLGNICDAVGGAADYVVSFGKNVVSTVKEEYKKHGWLYDVVEYGKCALKVGKGVVKIVGSVAAIGTGAGIPIGVLGIISAGNDIINAGTDAAYIYTDQYGQVGSANYLKDLLLKNGADLGEMLFGNKELGELLGKLTYTGMDLVTFLDGADKMLKSLGKVNTVVTNTTGYSFAWGMTSFDDIMDNKYKVTEWKDWVKKMFRIDPNSAANIALSAADKVKSVFQSAWKFGSGLAEMSG